MQQMMLDCVSMRRKFVIFNSVGVERQLPKEVQDMGRAKTFRIGLRHEETETLLNVRDLRHCQDTGIKTRHNHTLSH